MDATDVLVVGGGPAGLRAAEVARQRGVNVLLCDAQRSVGRKFLIAGRGGLNLTHGEPVENFPARYREEPERWRDLLKEFGPAELRSWASGLGIDTFVGTSGRVFPEGRKSGGLLRAWVRRLRAEGVEFRIGWRLASLAPQKHGSRLQFETQEGSREIAAGAAVLALGGASWPETGSDGTWVAELTAHGIDVVPWQPANCGWEVDWPPALLPVAEGLPIKNITVSAGGESVSGELLVTSYGIEGGAIYRLGPLLRAMPNPEITIDLRPQLAAEVLRSRSESSGNSGDWFRSWKLSQIGVALMEGMFPDDCADRDRAIARLKSFPLRLRRPRPIAEAISSAGGVAWRALDESLMLRKMPGVFVAGEMIDWEAPTGGYLLQGCFTTGTRAGAQAAGYAMKSNSGASGDADQ